MDLKLELVPVPVSDIDRAKAFYVDQLGFHEDVDVRPTDAVRVVQLTPPGSACSVVLGAGLPQIAMEPGSVKGLHLVVKDITEARAALIANGVEVWRDRRPGSGGQVRRFHGPRRQRLDVAGDGLALGSVELGVPSLMRRPGVHGAAEGVRRRCRRPVSVGGRVWWCAAGASRLCGPPPSSKASRNELV
jgi:catechol 2,3-dioxygenase-like lactoylglutathione lyase family enzyme